jgi:hypothetical protein
MPPAPRTLRRIRAVVGLVAGLLLLGGLILDGGASTPTRTDVRAPDAAAPAQDRSAPRPAASREDQGQWVHAPSSPLRVPAVGLPGAPAGWPAPLALGLVLLFAVARHGQGRVVEARLRGPPGLVTP